MTDMQSEKQTTAVSLIKEFELNELMGKIIDHCFDRWSEKDMLIANRIKQFVASFLEKKLSQELAQGKHWYFEGDELVITKGKWVIDRYKKHQSLTTKNEEAHDQS